MELTDLTLANLLVVAIAAFLTALLHGATGMAGGIVLAMILSHLVGVKTAIPIMTVALVISHASRAWLNRQHADWHSVKIVLLSSTPTILAGSLLFTYLNSWVVAAVMACFLMLSLPVKRYARQHRLQTGDGLLASAGLVWGGLAGNVIGPGFVLAPFLLGRGMGRQVFVGSLAVIVLVMNALKLLVFGATDLMTLPMLMSGLAIGLLTVPGNWLGKRILTQMSDAQHRTIIDLMTVVVALNFAIIAITDA